MTPTDVSLHTRERCTLSRTPCHADTCCASDTNSTNAATVAAVASSSCSRERQRERKRGKEKERVSDRPTTEERDGTAVVSDGTDLRTELIAYARRWPTTCKNKRPKRRGTTVTATTTASRNTHRARLASTEGGHATTAPSRVWSGCQRARDRRRQRWWRQPAAAETRRRIAGCGESI